MNDKFLLRIQRLLALAEKGSGATEAEAATAMAKAQELLAEHNLTIAAVMAAGGKDDEKREKKEVGDLKHGNGRGAMYQYQRQLMAALAKANFCSHWVKRSNRQWNGERWTTGICSHMLIGRESNVVTCRLMFEYLNETIERLVPYKGRERLSKSAISWKEGCAHRLIERIEQQFHERKAESQRKAEAARTAQPAAATGNALVIVLEDVVQSEADANSDFSYGWPAGTTKRKREEWERKWAQQRAEAALEPKEPETEAERRKREAREKRDRERSQARYDREWQRKDVNAYFAGQEAGQDISLNRQVDEKQVRKISG